VAIKVDQMKFYQIRQICNQRYISDPIDSTCDEKNTIYTQEQNVLNELKRILDNDLYFNDSNDSPRFNIPSIEKVYQCNDVLEIFNDDCLIIWINVLQCSDILSYCNGEYESSRF
jgi:hypothetical protein